MNLGECLMLWLLKYYILYNWELICIIFATLLLLVADVNIILLHLAMVSTLDAKELLSSCPSLLL